MGPAGDSWQRSDEAGTLKNWVVILPVFQRKANRQGDRDHLLPAEWRNDLCGGSGAI
jgi:hypothetical protein